MFYNNLGTYAKAQAIKQVKALKKSTAVKGSKLITSYDIKEQLRFDNQFVFTRQGDLIGTIDSLSYVDMCKDFASYFESNSKGRVSLDFDCRYYSIIRDMHLDHMPNDWVFAKAKDLVLSIIDHSTDDVESVKQSVVDNCVDVYNNDLLDWARYFWVYVDEMNEELGPLKMSFIESLRAGQYWHLEKIYDALVQGLEKLK